MAIANDSRLLGLTLLASLSLVACDAGHGDDGEQEEAYTPDVEPSDLSTPVDNQYLPFPVGAHWVYEAVSDEGTEHIEVDVLMETKSVAWGATGIVVKDTATVDGEITEDTRDWYAQEADGTVWYIGEDTAEYENGAVASREGAWEAGVDGALPGIAMLGMANVGDEYRQEYKADEAEDMGEVLSTNEHVEVPAGAFDGCLKTKDTSLIEPDVVEYKYYCPGVGLVLTEEDGVREELLSYSGL